MFDIPSIRLGKLFGIPFEVNLSWIFIFGLVSFALTTGYYPTIPASAGSPEWVFIVLGMVTSLAFFASIVAHELCHSLVTLAEGGRVEKITLFIFGGVSQIEDEPKSPGREFLMAAAGPGMSLFIAGVLYLTFALTISRGAPWWFTAPVFYLAQINLLVGVFNLLPGFPLDGGRVLRSILWAITGDVLKATRWATRSGQFIGWSLVGLAVLGVLQGNTSLIWFGLIGWFIAWLAGSAYRQQELRSRIAGVTVGSIMSPNPEYVDGDLTLEQLAHDHFLGGRHSRYPVMHNGTIVGLISLPDVKRVPRDDWPNVHVVDVANRDLSKVSVGVDTPVESVLTRIAGDVPGALLVVHGGHLAGIVTRADLLAFLQFQASKPEPPRS